MKTIHLEIDSIAYEQLKKKKQKGRYKNYSVLVEDLLKQDLQLDTINNKIDKLTNYNNLLIELVKQFYSDMGIVGLSDPKKCKNLQNFFNNRKKLNND